MYDVSVFKHLTHFQGSVLLLELPNESPVNLASSRCCKHITCQKQKAAD